MNREFCFVLILPLAGCAAPPKPAIVAAPTVIALATPEASKPLIAPAIPATSKTPVVADSPVTAPETPTPNSYQARAQAIVMRELTRLRNASPERDVEVAWADKDARFIGVGGRGVNPPGVPYNRHSKLVNKYGINIIKGTGDVIFSPEVEQLNVAAKRYATRYNRLLLAKLDARQSAAK